MSMPSSPPTAAEPRRGKPWWLIPAGLAVALVFLALGAWLGWALLAHRLDGLEGRASLIDEARTREEIALQKKANEALEQRIAEAKKILESDVCTADNPFGNLPAPPESTAPPAEAVPTPEGGRSFEGNLLDLVDSAVVMVLSPREEGVAMGSGFFVAPGLVVTNAHVVAGAEKIFVTSKPLGGAKAATLVASTNATDPGEVDFALLKVGGAPATIQPLSVTTTLAKLDHVVAAGFPGIVMAGDQAFRRLIEQGDASAVPEMAVTSGEVSVMQDLAGGVPVVVHTAGISPGNSGGPLVDRCGRVVGVNTFLMVDAAQAVRVNYALASAKLIAFLKSQNVGVTELSGRCVPANPSADTPAGPAAASGQGGGAATPATPSK